MVQNSKFSVQLLEKIGAPLAAAIEAVPPKGEDQEVEAAKLIAQMLGQAVQMSISLNGTLGLNESEEQADSTRLALAAVSAPLIADFYRKNERVPEDQDIKRLVKSQEAVLAFAENFTPASDAASRLSTIDHDTPLFDETQPSLVMLQVLAPVINAISEFPFGQGEIKLLQEVSARLEQDAASMVKDLSGADKLQELMVFKALANVYAECHRAETARLSTASDDERGELSLDPVWETYGTKQAMMAALVGQTADSTAVSGPAPVAEKPAEIQDVQPAAQAAPAAPSEAPSSGPMGFFKPGAKTAAAAVPTTPVEEPAPAEPVATTTPTQAPASEGGGGPMSFFKPGAKKDGEESSSS